MTDTAAPAPTLALPAGLTLRDYFAGCALSALLPTAVQAVQDAIMTREGQAGQTIDLAVPGVRWACMRAYNVADAMLGMRDAQLAAAPAAPPQGIVLPGPGSNGHAGA